MRAITVIALVACAACSASSSKPAAVYDPDGLKPIAISPEGEADLRDSCRVVAPPKADSPVQLALTLKERAERAHFTIDANANVVVVPHLTLVDCDQGFEGQIRLDVFEAGRQIDRIVDDTVTRTGPWKNMDAMADWAIAKLLASRRVYEALAVDPR